MQTSNKSVIQCRRVDGSKRGDLSEKLLFIQCDFESAATANTDDSSLVKCICIYCIFAYVPTVPSKFYILKIS